MCRGVAMPSSIAPSTCPRAASAPEAGKTTGGYFHDLKAVPPAPAALDDGAAARFWVESEKLIARIGV